MEIRNVFWRVEECSLLLLQPGVGVNDKANRGQRKRLVEIIGETAGPRREGVTNLVCLLMR